MFLMNNYKHNSFKHILFFFTKLIKNECNTKSYVSKYL